MTGLDAFDKAGADHGYRDNGADDGAGHGPGQPGEQGRAQH